MSGGNLWNRRWVSVLWDLVLSGVVLILLGILLPLSAYAAQKWTYRTYREVEKLNAKLEEVLVIARTKVEPTSGRTDRP